MRSKGSLRRHFYRPRAGARRANHHPSLALVAPMSHCFAGSLALLLSLPKELSLLPPPAALQFLAPQRRGTMGRVSKYFEICRFLPRQTYLPHPLTATRYPQSPTISQTRKLFMKLCANSTLSLQISLISSVLVRGLLFTGKYSKSSASPRRKTRGQPKNTSPIEKLGAC